MNPMISFNRSNSSIAFDNFFNPTHSVDDILDDTLVDMCPFEALLGPLPENPDQICDIFMNDKAGRNLIDEFLPSSPESIDQSVHSPPPSSEYTADSPFSTFDENQQDEFLYETSEENKFLVVQNNDHQMIAVQEASPEIILQQMAAQVNAEQILVKNGDQNIVYNFVCQTTDNGFIKTEQVDQITKKQQSAVSLALKTEKASPQQQKLRQNREASARYRKRKRENEIGLLKEIKQLEENKHTLEKEFVKIEAINKCLVAQLRQKFAHLL